jgi:hypothetical protein
VQYRACRRMPACDACVLCSLDQRRAESMSKTPKEAVSKFLLAFQSDRDTIEQGYSDLVTTLGEAGL